MFERVSLGLLLCLILVPAQPVHAQPSFEDIVGRLSATSATLTTLIADQIVDVQWLGIFRWRVRGTVYAARPARYRVVLHNPPLLLRRFGAVFSNNTSPERLLLEYRADRVRERGGGLLEAEVTARTLGVNPPRARVVVDSHRWLIMETALRYEWGELAASYTYQEIEGYALPVLIEVSVPAYWLRARLRLENYRLNVPLPQGVFEIASP